MPTILYDEDIDRLSAKSPQPKKILTDADIDRLSVESVPVQFKKSVLVDSDIDRMTEPFQAKKTFIEKFTIPRYEASTGVRYGAPRLKSAEFMRSIMGKEPIFDYMPASDEKPIITAIKRIPETAEDILDTVTLPIILIDLARSGIQGVKQIGQVLRYYTTKAPTEVEYWSKWTPQEISKMEKHREAVSSLQRYQQTIPKESSQYKQAQEIIGSIRKELLRRAAEPVIGRTVSEAVIGKGAVSAERTLTTAEQLAKPMVTPAITKAVAVTQPTPVPQAITPAQPVPIPTLAQIPIEPSTTTITPTEYEKAKSVAQAPVAPVSLPPAPKPPKPKITIETIRPDQFGKTALSREIAAMQDRIEKAKMLEASLEEVERMRTAFAHRIQKYESMGIGGKFLKEELPGIPSYYITREAGIKPDEAIEEMQGMGITVQDEVGMKDFLINLESQRKALIAEIKETKPRIVTETGKETTFLIDKVKTFIQGQKVGTREGKLVAEEKYLPKITAMKEKFQSAKLAAKEKFKYFKSTIQRRRQWLNLVQESYELTDAEFIRAKVNRNYATMTDFEFHTYLDTVEKQTAQIAERKEAMNALSDHIASKELKIDNLRVAMKLPALKDMTIDQICKMDEALEPFQLGDVFLSVRELETIDRTELAGKKTFREVRQYLAKEYGISEEAAIKVSEFDRFRWDTPLAQKDPYFKMLVEKTAEKLLMKTTEYLEIEKRILALAKKIKTTFVQKLIPQYEKIMQYMETPAIERTQIQLTPEEQDLTAEMTIEFDKVRDYLIQIGAMKTGRENYFTHIRRGILEALKEEGIGKTGIRKVIDEFIHEHEMQEKSFDIVNYETGEILPFDKHFRFVMHRTGEIVPTKNVVKTFLTYMKMFKRKQALDEITPLLEIFTKALTPSGLTQRGLLLHGNLMKFFKQWMNTKRGRHISAIAKQGGVIERGLNSARLFVSVIDLACNFSVQFGSEIGEQITTYQLLGARNFKLGKVRYNTPQGRLITQKYENFIGKNPWTQLFKPAREIGERLMDSLFILFRDAFVRANKTFLLGSLTMEEFQTGEINPRRLAALRTELGRYRDIEDAESIFGATPEGRTYTQYKGWALPILQTNLKNLKNVTVRLKNPRISVAEKKQSAVELYRLIYITAFVLIVYNLIPKERKENDSFSGGMLKKAYREMNTLIQGLSPRLFLYWGRVPAFLVKFGENLQALLTWETYKTPERKGELKGVTGLKRQFTPMIFKQFSGKQEQPNKTNKSFRRSFRRF